MSTRSANASDVGLIVQGALILLSALVAVAGYFVQGRIRKKERKRESEQRHLDYLRQGELELLRTKLREFVGPAAHLGMCAWNVMWKQCFSTAMTTAMGAQEEQKRPIRTLNSLAGGDRVHKFWNTPGKEGGLGFTFPKMMQGKFNAITSLVGPTVEQEIRDAPDSKLAKHYFQVCRRLVRKYCAPLRDLVVTHAQTLDARPSAEKFKDQYPVLKGAGWLRNYCYMEFVEWAHEFEEILDQWDGGCYESLWPTATDFPMQIVNYLTNQLTHIRETETKLGAARHQVMNDADDQKRVLEMAKERAQEDAKDASGEEGSSEPEGNQLERGSASSSVYTVKQGKSS